MHKHNVTQIISTRKLDTALKKAAMEKGIIINDYDFLTFYYPESKELAEIISLSRLPFIFTSRHAIEAVERISAKYKFSLEHKQCYCIEGNTSDYARKIGFNVIGTGGNSSQLGAKIVSQNIHSIIYLSGNIRREQLLIILKAKDIKVKEYIVYYKTLVPYQINNDYNGVLFFSPSQVDAFSVNNILSHDTPAFCIGETTQEHLKSKGHLNIITSKKKSTESVLEKVFAFNFSNNK